VARIQSFVVLLIVLLAVAALFVYLMADFLLPLFLSLLLVVIFGPVHRWITERLGGRRRIAAAATTVAILLVVLLPLTGLMTMATVEGVRLYEQLSDAEVDLHDVARQLSAWAGHVGWNLPADEIEQEMTERAKQMLAPLVLATPGFIGRTLIGLAVMILGVYFFFADGPAMIRTVMRLSPLDDKYEEQLIRQFDVVTRAVVLATLLSAAAQGLLAAIGYWFLDLGSVALLSMLTGLLAMVPFLGAASVWLPVAGWLIFFQDRPIAGLVLLVYGTLVVSLVDNLIKPLILHGRSSLHPMLALLAIIGGVQAMGPVGIFVGPMVVAFFQALLNMLHEELGQLGADVSITREDVKQAIETETN